jgi:GNAT superfamily N-acetyltransferase
MDIQNCTKADFDFIVGHVAEFWGDDRTLNLHHPMFLYEFGDTAFVLRDGDHVMAYLFGVFSQTEPTAYVHLVGVHETARRRGFAKQLYEHFAAVAIARGCTQLKAITTAGNRASLAFHRSIGMVPVAGGDAVDVVRDYGGPGQDRVVMRKRLE